METKGSTAERDWEGFWPVVERSTSIERHFDFYLWMQTAVRDYVPHDILIAAWGDFDNGNLSFDVVSSLPEVRTRHALKEVKLDELVGNLYQRWATQGSPWFVSGGLSLGPYFRGCSPHPFVSQLLEMRSLLVCGIRDRRSGHNALYVFLDQSPTFEVEPRALRTLLPHIDGALRRIDGLSVSEGGQVPESIALSGREQEIMTWITHGKTNDEIAIILGISSNTVKNHLKRLFRKLDVTNRTQAVAQFRVSTEIGAATRVVSRRPSLMTRMEFAI